MYQVSCRSEKLCEAWNFLEVFAKIQNGAKSIMATWFVKIGWTGQTWQTWTRVQLWPVGGARALEPDTQNLLWVIMGLALIYVPNFSTFYHGVLWAAIDSNGRRRKRNNNKKTYKNNGLPSQLRSLAPKYSCKQRCRGQAEWDSVN